MHQHRITCEECGKTTRSGIIEKDKGGRDRYFCSDKCLNIKIKRYEENIKIWNKPLWKKILGWE